MALKITRLQKFQSVRSGNTIIVNKIVAKADRSINNRIEVSTLNKEGKKVRGSARVVLQDSIRRWYKAV